MRIIPIKEIQGSELNSPLAGQSVRTRGVVTSVSRRGFFIQTSGVTWDGVASDAIFIYGREPSVIVGVELEVLGKVIDYVKGDNAKPVTQIQMDEVCVIRAPGYAAQVIELSAEFLPPTNVEMALLLNSLEGMLVRIPKGQTFIAPSNPFGDYVLAMDGMKLDTSVLRSKHNGVIAGRDDHLRWFPGFRITNYNHAQRLNVGARLISDVVGPLNYRVDSYQLSVDQPFTVEPAFIPLTKSDLKPSEACLTVMTLNCFNLDPHVESEDRVVNPRQDVDDDWGGGRFHTLAQAVVLQANVPDIVALQEIQDNDGAQISEVIDADDTYRLLVNTIHKMCGIRYRWVDVNPEQGADGGQPGGNIRNGYLFNPERVEVDLSSVRVFGAGHACFEDSRKPLLVVFSEKASGLKLACINVHLASKRHQNSIFAPLEPGIDGKLDVRVAQANVISQEMQVLTELGTYYYLTGDFNDTEHSDTLLALLGEHSANLVESLPETERYDYNHRGKLQVLMHGIIPRKLYESGGAEYQIIHGNELLGVTPGEESNKPSDHAYVIAKLKLN
jgi:predicted extracellular nuclease